MCFCPQANTLGLFGTMLPERPHLLHQWQASLWCPLPSLRLLSCGLSLWNCQLVRHSAAPLTQVPNPF